MFFLHRDELKGEELIKPLTKKIVAKVNEDKPDVLPKCHLKMIIQRFITGRIHWWLEQESYDDREAGKNYLKNEAMSSKTQKTKQVGKEL